MRRWICKICGKQFDPLTSDGDFDFNCPNCGSQLTSPVGKLENKIAEELEDQHYS